MSAWNNDKPGKGMDILIAIEALILVIIALTDPQGLPYVVAAIGGSLGVLGLGHIINLLRGGK